jgi:hypothetical protein
MPENSVTPQPRHDSRQSVGVEAEIVGEIVPPERHFDVDDDADCRRRSVSIASSVSTVATRCSLENWPSTSV